MSTTPEVVTALIATLSADDALCRLMPDGTWLTLAPVGAKAFVVVSLSSGHDTEAFGTRAFQEQLYLVKAVQLSPSRSTTDEAAARIDALLSGQQITAENGAVLSIGRLEPIAYTEVDENEADIRWQHSGGIYQVFAN